ncbi:MAG: dTDP-4-dehydrorhamnose reductase [Candidatus Omnitrophota bacterium]
MKILVTGSEGMLGSAIIRSLESREIHTESADMRDRDNPVDIRKELSLSDFMKKVNPDAVIHTAAFTDVDGCEKDPAKAHAINVEGTKNISLACLEIKCPMLYISTDYIFDGKSESPYKEEDEAIPLNVYGNSKLEGENTVRSMLNSYLIVRTSWLFGEGGRNFVDSIISLAESGKKLKVVDDQKGSPTYTADLGEAIAELLLKAFARNRKTFSISHNTLNITNSGSCTWYEFAKEILKLKGIKQASISPCISSAIDRPAKRPKMSVLDNSRFIKLYGKPLPSWQDALSRYLNVGAASRRRI